MKHQSGRIIGMFGLPCSGKTTIIKTLIESSKEIIAHISTGDIARRLSSEKELNHMAEGNLFPLEDMMREEILKLIQKRQGQGSEVIILDSCPRFDDQVKWMLDNQLAGVGSGLFIKVIGDHLRQRAELRARDNQDELDKFDKKVVIQQKMIDGMEKLIFRYGIPYYTIMNTDLSHAVVNFAKIIGIRK